MKHLKIILLSMLTLCFVGCENKPFTLEEQYYNTSEIIEIGLDEYNDLIESKENIGIFIYQPMCFTSSEFEEIVKDFSEEYQITFYKIPFSLLKETELNESIKYYPSFAIIENGKLISFLDANSDEDIEYYKTIDGFKAWLEKYIILEK